MMNQYSLFNSLLIQNELQKRANPYFEIEETLQKRLRLENERYEIIKHNQQIYNNQLAFLQLNELMQNLNQYNNHLLQNSIINQQLTPCGQNQSVMMN